MSIFPAVRPAVTPAVRGAFEQSYGGGSVALIKSLFAAGQQGFWLPFTDFASLSQDSAGTLPYTALEQPVGRVLDRSGRGNHASQVTSSARGKVSAAVVSPPTRPYYLQLDGVDDFYTCGGGGSTTGFYFSDVVRPMGGAGTARFIMSDRTTGNVGIILQINTSNKLELAVGNTTTYVRVSSAETLAVGTAYWCEALDDGVNLQVRVNNGAPVSVPRPTPTAGGSILMLYKHIPGNDAIFNGNITEPIYRAGPPPSAYERSVIRTYQMQKAGLL